MNSTPKQRKGTYSSVGLSVVKKYFIPGERQQMLRFGAYASLALIVIFCIDAFVPGHMFVSPGPVSSNHASFSNDCASCHDDDHGITDAKCMTCHEKTSEMNIYDFAAHYSYRSGDHNRSLQKSKDFKSMELACSDCHLEHMGRDQPITAVVDAKCAGCHEGNSSFSSNHFEFAALDRTRPQGRYAADDSTLSITHIRHTIFVLENLKNIRIDTPTMKKYITSGKKHFFEEACLFCHNPEPSGKNFSNIDFTRHCGTAGCHIGPDKAAIGLPELASPNSLAPGVESLQAIKKRGGPGVMWAFSLNENTVKLEDGEISKTPIEHKDPWILENLRQIRRKLFPGSTKNLGDLLSVDGDATGSRSDTLYSKAIQTLRLHVNELRGRPELGEELDKIEALLAQTKEKMIHRRQQKSTEKTFAKGKITSRLSETRKAEFMQLVDDLTNATTTECQKCHQIDNAAFKAVQADQNEFIRAEFDHRAHILEQRCTDCHKNIPISPAVLLRAKKAGSLPAVARMFPTDRAATHNLPGIESCRECHTGGKVASSCTSCHQFHPDKKQKTNFRIFGTTSSR